ncbi:hypothetical protein PG997_011204 [Apiospora hydei]|uniref:Uncharacterized protein n=1 Tax=Apiospora hydei TaxID=1337664 RepID=A0ABR1VL21_9PEZI
MPHDDRERYLAEVYCFACDCALCSLAPGPWRDDVDERLRQLETFWRKYHLGESDGPPLSPSSSSTTSSTAAGAATTTTATPSLPSDEPASDVLPTEVREGNDDGADAAVVDVKSLNQRRFLHDPTVCFAECREAAELILEAEEDVGDGAGGEDGDIAGCIDVTFAYEIALALTLLLGDAARASVFAARNRDRYIMTLGADSASAVRAGLCARNPCADRSFGLGLGGGGRIPSRVPDVGRLGRRRLRSGFGVRRIGNWGVRGPRRRQGPGTW